MKYSKFFSLILFISVISFYGCNDSGSTNESKESPGITDSPNFPNTTTPNPATLEPPQNAEGVWHYTCSKGCAGGAGAAGNCATCGGPLAHNTAYHSNTSNPPTTSPIIPPTTEPAQNAAGVWHYICGKGCAGGSGAAGPCSTCGGTLVHNAAYH